MKVFLFPISGIVGSGKSTAMKRLKNSGLLLDEVHRLWDDTDTLPDVVFVQEPIKLWREKGWVQRYYAEPDLYAAAFQFIVFCTHAQAIEQCIKDNAVANRSLVIICERSMYDQLLFWYQQRDLNKLTADDMYHDAYMMMWELRHRYVPKPSGIFFFYTSDIQQTMLRVKRRARAEELGVSSYESAEDSLNSSRSGLTASKAGPEEIQEVNGLTVDYQERLLERHQAWFTEPIARPPGADASGIPCMHVIADAPFHDNDGSLLSLAKRMARFICENVK